MCACGPRVGLGGTHGAHCPLFAVSLLEPSFFPGRVETRFPSGEDGRQKRNKKLSWFSCKHSVRCRAGTQQERGTEERQGQRTVGAERHGEKRWGARDHRFRAWVGVGCQGEGEGKGLISQRVEGTRGGGNPYTEWQTGPGGREPLGSYYSLNILPILGSGDAKVSQIDTCLLL